jgi:hypothetical protein
MNDGNIHWRDLTGVQAPTCGVCRTAATVREVGRTLITVSFECQTCGRLWLIEKPGAEERRGDPLEGFPGES